MKILLVGGNGYLGARLVIILASKGYIVDAFIRSDKGINETWANCTNKIIYGDVTKSNCFKNLLTEYNVIINLVSLDHNETENNHEIICNSNIMPTWAILEECKENQTLFIYFSTMQVMGDYNVRAEINEESKAMPTNKYGLTHLMTENLVSYYNSRYTLNAINLRLTNGYGYSVFTKNKCWNLVANDFCKCAFEDKKIIIRSDGTGIRNFININDIGDAVDIVINNKNAIKDINILHLSTDDTLTILELAEKVKNIYYKKYNEEITIVNNKNEIINESDNFLLTR